MSGRQQTFDFAADAEPPAEARQPKPQPVAVLPNAGETVYVVDAPALIYQVFHALPEMSGPQGQPVGAIHGFTRDLADILQRQQPTYLFCAFDASGPTFRHELFRDYKVHREEMPPDLRAQFSGIERMLTALGIPILSIEGYEADDILATVARITEERGGECYLVTGDKDCRQLISPQVKMYNIRKNQVIDAAAVREDWGITPEQVVDFQALWGDTIDNVPGIPGVGKKIAAELLQKYRTLEGIYEHLDEIRQPKRRENLAQGWETVQMSRELVRLNRHVPMEIDWRGGRVGNMDTDAVLALCAEFGFRRLSEQLTGLSVREAPDSWKANYRLVGSIEQLKELAGQLAGVSRLSIDTETTSPHPRLAQLVGYALAWKVGEAAYVPIRAPEGEPALDAAVVQDALRPILEDPAVKKVGQNLKYDLIVMRSHGLRPRGELFDTMVADYLLDPGQRNHGLDDLARRYLNHENIKISELIGKGRSQKGMDEVPLDQVVPYASEDADVAFRLAGILDGRLKREQLDGLFHELEMPLMEVLAEMEYTGIRIHVPRLQELSGQFGRRLAELEQEIHEMAGGPFNIESPSQLARILFQELKLPVMKRTKSGPSTDADVLSQLEPLHPLPAKVVEYRQYAKLKSTYVDALPTLVNPATGRVHTSFKQDVAATGRLSSTDPNLQNIPIRTEVGRQIRSAFLPGADDWVLVAADYSQIELRMLAHFSGDAALRAAFGDDRDIHAQVAAEVYGVDLDQVSGDMRRSAKAINFGIIYGQSPFGLAKSLNIPKEQAAVFIKAYFARYPGVLEFMENVLNGCRNDGFVTTALGRRRAIQGVRSAERRGDSLQRILPERIAINTVIQGSAADLIKQAMIRIHRRLDPSQWQARMLLQIHDELIFECPPEEQARLIDLVRSEMIAAGELEVPLKVDVKVGRNWAAAE